MSLAPDQVIDGKYRIVRQLGVGGMGAVYEGENVRIHRKVAIKVLHAQVATKADIVQRFEREAQAAGRIGSKHIVEVLDLGNLPAGDRYMVMEYLEGESLGERLKRVKNIAPADLARIMVQVLDGLAAAHEAGIVHRDLKPDNIYLLKPRSLSRPEEFVKLLDFGVSKFSSLDSDMSMTSTGAVMGTPYYLSPEQARGGKVDARSDLYAIGVVLYQCLAGHVPFQAESFNELLFKIALENPKPLGVAVPGIDPGLVALVEKGMAREPAARFQTASEMRDALLAWAQSAAGGGAMIALRNTGGGPAMSPALAASLAASTAGAAAPFGASGAMLQMSGVGAAPLGLSGAVGPSPLAASGAGAPPFGATGAPAHAGALHQSGGPLNQSGSPLNQSAGAMAVTAPQPARKPVVALLVGTLVAGCALGGGMWLAFGSKAGPATGAENAPTTITTAEAPSSATGAPAAPDAPSAPDTAAPAASAAPSSAEPAASSEPAASAEPAARAAAGAPATTGDRPRSGGKKPPSTGGTRPPSGGTKPPPAGAGRVITPTL